MPEILISFKTEWEATKYPKLNRDHKRPNTTYAKGLQFAGDDPWKISLLQVEEIDFNDWIIHLWSIREQWGVTSIFYRMPREYKWVKVFSTDSVFVLTDF